MRIRYDFTTKSDGVSIRSVVVLESYLNHPSAPEQVPLPRCFIPVAVAIGVDACAYLVGMVLIDFGFILGEVRGKDLQEAGCRVAKVFLKLSETT